MKSTMQSGRQLLRSAFHLSADDTLPEKAEEKKEEKTEGKKKALNPLKYSLLLNKMVKRSRNTKKKTSTVHGHLLLAVACVSNSSFQMGFNGSLFANPQTLDQFLNRSFETTTNLQQQFGEIETRMLWFLVTSVYSIGGILGSMIAVALCDKLGRKKSLLCNNSLTIGGAVLMALSYNLERTAASTLLVLSRLTVGLSSGLVCVRNKALVNEIGVAGVGVPVYLSEISPIQHRGKVGTVHAIVVITAASLAGILGINNLFGQTKVWPILLTITAVPILIQLVLLPFAPETPSFICLNKMRTDRAEKVLKWLRTAQDMYRMSIDDELSTMRSELRDDYRPRKMSVSVTALRDDTSLRVRLQIAIVLQLSQQLAGMDAIGLYASEAQNAPNVSELFRYITVVLGVANVSCTIISAILMDRVGRRRLQLAGLGGMFAFSLLLTVSFLVKHIWASADYVTIASMTLFVASFAIGPAAIPWLLVPELFGHKWRVLAMAIAMSFNWLAELLVGVLFLNLEVMRKVQDYSFLPYSVLLAIFWILVYKMVPETAQRTTSEVRSMFQRNNGQGLFDQPVEETDEECQPIIDDNY